jgi:hypothetical protein
MPVEDQLGKMQQQEEAVSLVGAIQDNVDQGQLPKQKEVRVIREEVRLEDEDEDDEGDEIEGDMDDLLAGLPDDTEVIHGLGICLLLLSVHFRKSILSTRV